jgi:hypothetical protein
MKVQATALLTVQAKSLAEAGALLDDVLARARERDHIDVGRVEVASPAAGSAGLAEDDLVAADQSARIRVLGDEHRRDLAGRVSLWHGGLDRARTARGG